MTDRDVDDLTPGELAALIPRMTPAERQRALESETTHVPPRQTAGEPDLVRLPGERNEFAAFAPGVLPGLALAAGHRRAARVRPRRGRPRWQALEFDVRLAEAGAAAGGPGASPAAVARHFRPLEKPSLDGKPQVGIDPGTLAGLIRDRLAGRMR